MSSTGVNLSRSRAEAEFLPPPICLYKFNLVTSRIKEQKATFVGIVRHVKQGNWDNDSKKSKEIREGQLTTSQIDMESVDDKSRVALFVKHDPSLDLKNFVLKDSVALVRNAERKISNNLDIYCQLQMFQTNFKVIGKVTEEVSDFSNTNRI